MLFKQHQYHGLTDGSITVTFRRWAQPRVRTGGQYRVSPQGVLEVEAVDQIRAGQVTEADARRSGFADRAALIAQLERGASSRVAKNTKLFRVVFHYVPLADERPPLAEDAQLTADEAGDIAAKLERMDSRSQHGPWTRQTLAVIEQRPRTPASALATPLGRERLAFKADVRRLKKLGLTVSFDTGYELSPRGRAFLARHGA